MKRRSQGATASTAILIGGCLCLLSCSSDPPLDKDGNPITLGQYRIRTYPRGARVYVDGELKVPATPATLVLDAGRYHLRIIHPGAKKALERDITVYAGRSRTLDTRIPAPEKSTLSVVSDVEGAGVRINGYRRGTTPLDPVPVRAGPVNITVTAPDGRARSASTKLSWGAHEVLRVDFSTDTATSTGPGRITIILAPAGVVESETGQTLGSTPLKNFSLPAGRHRLILKSKDGRYRKEVTPLVEPGRHATYRFRLGQSDLTE